ncbi:MAG: hypothetical protein KGZ74_13010 [Chitinophagaceae bacterium]|nr:hypothetical protein [Chitinophagaceae bacterium]
MKHLFILFLLSASNAAAQTAFNKYSWQIKLAPLRLLDPVNHGLELSTEKNHKKQSTQLTAAYLFQGRIDGYDNLRGLRLGIEKKFFTNQTNRFRNYFSIDMVLSQLRCDDVTYFNDTINNIRIEDPFQIEKKLAILQFKIGKQFLWNRFVIDISAGAGAKYIRTKHIDRTYPPNKSRGLDIILLSKNEVNRVTLNIPVTIRIGFIL